MRFILVLWTLLIISTSVNADSLSLQNLYINPEKQDLSEVIIFHNSANTCENCNTAINMIINVLKNNYKNKIHAYLINVQNHPEFISAFKLKGPLNLVVIRISDGASFGYQKLTGLQSETHSPNTLKRRITEFIDNFLGF